MQARPGFLPRQGRISVSCRAEYAAAMTTPCHETSRATLISKPHSEPLTVLAASAACALERSLHQFVLAADHNLGHLERQAEHEVKERPRQAIERSAQAKADAIPPRCPGCGKPLNRLSGGHTRTFECCYGVIRVQRSRGYCQCCGKWRMPADTARGLKESAGDSPTVQDRAAMLASKMPGEEARAVLEHLPGVKLPRAPLGSGSPSPRRTGSTAAPSTGGARREGVPAVGTDPRALPEDYPVGCLGHPGAG